MTAAEPLPMAATTGAQRARASADRGCRRGDRVATPPQRGTGRRAAGRAQRTRRADQIVAIETDAPRCIVRLLWALADAFEVPFSVLLSGAPCATTSFHVLRAADAPVVDFHRWRLSYTSVVRRRRSSRNRKCTRSRWSRAGWKKAAPHAVDTFEHVVVVRGMLTVRAGASTAVLAPGDAVFFRADCPHAYQNPGIDRDVTAPYDDVCRRLGRIHDRLIGALRASTDLGTDVDQQSYPSGISQI